MKKAFSIPPSTNLVDVLSYSGYSFSAAVADIIDNSISANAKNILIYFDVSEDPTNEELKPFLYILDDGDGMNEEEMKKAFILAEASSHSKRDTNDLGRYSLGLKSASSSYCRQMYLVSKVKDKSPKTLEMDFDYIEKERKWEGFEIDNFAYEDVIKDHGSIVFWSKLNFKNDSELTETQVYTQIDRLKKELGHIFGKYILERGLNIYIQSAESLSEPPIKIEGWNPFYIPNSKSISRIYNGDIQFKGEKISIKSYILPPYGNLDKTDQRYIDGIKGMNEQQGFYIYRNGRLIQEGGWLGLKDLAIDQKCSMARIEVDIGTQLDKEFNVNFNKSQITVPIELEKEFLDIAKKTRTASKKNFNYINDPNAPRRTRQNKENIPVWRMKSSRDGINLQINENHPLIKEMFEKLGKRDSNKLKSLLSKNVPISALQTNPRFTENEYTMTEIDEMVKEYYVDQKSKGVSDDEIRETLLKTEPFYKYKERVLMCLIDLKEELSNE